MLEYLVHSDLFCERANGCRELRLDSVFSTNLLEHLKDDVGVLRQMKEIAGPHGRVVNLVPAFRKLYGPVDRAIGHYRRYERDELVIKHAAAGLRMQKLKYFNLAGYLSWAWLSRVQKSPDVSQLQFKSFNAVVPALELFERLVPPIVESSLVSVGEPDAD